MMRARIIGGLTLAALAVPLALPSVHAQAPGTRTTVTFARSQP